MTQKQSLILQANSSKLQNQRTPMWWRYQSRQPSLSYINANIKSASGYLARIDESIAAAESIEKRYELLAHFHL